MKYLFLALLLLGCEEERRVVETKSTNNRDYGVSLLFEVDGCKVYRFDDKGYYRYFANCGGNGEVSWREKCGKSCNRPVEVPSTWRDE